MNLKLEIMLKRMMIAFLSLILVSTTAWTQEEKIMEQQQTKKEKKEAREARQKANYQAILELLDKGEFVIEAYHFSDRYGQQIQVNPSTTFIAVRDSVATIQITFPGSAGLGYNGLGGITMDGQLTELKVIDKNPDKGVTFQLRVFGNAFASSDMFVDVNNDGYASVRYTGAFGGRFELDGDFRSWGQSSIFKGSTLY
jgi:hypothetical protein